MSGLTLKHFILKQKVLDLYRFAIRASRGQCMRNFTMHLLNMLFNLILLQSYLIPVLGRKLLRGYEASSSEIAIFMTWYVSLAAHLDTP